MSIVREGLESGIGMIDVIAIAIEQECMLTLGPFRVSLKVLGGNEKDPLARHHPKQR